MTPTPPPRYDVDDLIRCVNEDALIIDGRTQEAFASGDVRGSLNVGLDGRFAEYAGAVVRAGQPIVVVTDEGRDVEAKVRLAGIGFDRVRGAVVDVERILTNRPDLIVRAARLAANDVARWRDEAADLQIVDVRNPSEHQTGVITGARRIPLAHLLDRHGELDRQAPTLV